MPVSPSPAASSSTRSPGCRASASSIRCDTGEANSRIISWRRSHPEAAASQPSRLASRWALASKLTAAPAQQLARACARQRLVGRDELLGHLVRRERAGAVRAQLLDVQPLAGARDDDRRHGLAPLRVEAAEHSRLEHPRMRLEHGLDLGGRDVLAAADDRVGLASAHPQAAALVELAEVAGMQPAVGCERSRCHCRPGHEDLAVFSDPQTGAEQRRAGARGCAADLGDRGCGRLRAASRSGRR